MKVSIIIPVYNVAHYIMRCLQSVEAQTYPEIECLLIDDCGKDNSMLLVNKFIGKYKGIIHFSIIQHQQNQGLSAARNTGMKAATGEYIYFLDSDDAITPDCIKVLTDLAKKYPDADYIQGNIVTGIDQLNEGNIDADVPEYCDEKRLLEKIILCKTHRTAWNRLMKRSFLMNNSIFFPVGLVMEDHYWTYFVSKQANAVVFCRKETYYYYKNNESIVNCPSKASLIKRYSSYQTIIETISRDLLLRCDLQPCHGRYVEEAVVFCMFNLARLQSFRHWCIFWKFACCTAYKCRTKFTWRRFLLFMCTMPPLCLMTDIKGWRWRVRQYTFTKI